MCSSAYPTEKLASRDARRVGQKLKVRCPGGRFERGGGGQREKVGVRERHASQKGQQGQSKADSAQRS